MPTVVIEALAEHVRCFPPDERPSASRLVFTDEHGEPLRRPMFGRTVWRPAVAAAGVPHGTGMHDLRHFYASLLVTSFRHGESVKVVQARLGHATAAETLAPTSACSIRAELETALDKAGLGWLPTLLVLAHGRKRESVEVPVKIPNLR